MKYIIQIMEEKITIIDNQTKEQKILTGYSFIGDHGHCMIIAWGENRKNVIIELFSKII